MKSLKVIKIGGAELAPGKTLDELTNTLAQMTLQNALIIVHGGGPEIAEYQKKLGLEPRFLDGLRVTDDETMKAAEMVLSGLVNKRLTAKLNARDIKAIGISGVDAGLLTAEKKLHSQGDLGRVGRIISIDCDVLDELMDLDYAIVVSPISADENGDSLNVNADEAASAIASAMSVEELIYLTDTPGVLVDGNVVPKLTEAEALALIDSGVIAGGMMTKVRTAISAVNQGVSSVRIVNLENLATGGTAVISAEHEA